MDNYGPPFDGPSPICSDDEWESRSPDGVFSDEEEEKQGRVKNFCDFCIQERRWIERVKEMRIACETEALRLADIQVGQKEKGKVFEAELRTLKHEQERLFNELKFYHALIGKVSRLGIGICGCRRPILPGVNEELRVALLHMTGFFEQPVHTPEDPRAPPRNEEAGENGPEEEEEGTTPQ
ncbi:hypothetical protein OSTOST_04718 [Ostertagia ostertagi]